MQHAIDFGANSASDASTYCVTLSSDVINKKITISKYRPEEFVDQKGFQGYSRITKLMKIDKNQSFVSLNSAAWRKFRKLYKDEKSGIRVMVEAVDKEKKCMLVFDANGTQFIELIMGQKLSELSWDKDGGKIVYSIGKGGLR